MKPYSETTIELFGRSITQDEFDDNQQNENIYGDDISGYDIYRRLVMYLSPKNVLFAGSGSSKHSGFSHPVNSFYLEPNKMRSEDHVNVINGWCENIAVDILFDCIVCWGTLCFVRSLPETLIQFNCRLNVGGHLVLDVVKSTVMPLCQTVDPDSFVRYIHLYGFDLEQRCPFGLSTHVREGFRFKKTRSFDPAYLRMPQCSGKIRNFLFERDWFLS